MGNILAITPADTVQLALIGGVTLAVLGLYVLAGMPDNGILTCIDPEAEHQRSAKEAFREAGYAPSRGRFLPSRPLEVMGRLANDAYQVIYADVAALDTDDDGEPDAASRSERQRALVQHAADKAPLVASIEALLQPAKSSGAGGWRRA